MKNIKTSILFLLSLSVFSCASNHNTENIEKETKESNLKQHNDTNLNNQDIETTAIRLSSSLRPNKSISLNKTYTDTIQFDSYNDDGDYFILIGKNRNNEVSLIYNWEWYKNDKYDFKNGDLLEVKWKMDSIWIAGDDESFSFFEKAIDAKKIVNPKTH